MKVIKITGKRLIRMNLGSIVFLVLACFLTTPVMGGFHGKQGDGSFNRAPAPSTSKSAKSNPVIYIDYADKTVLESDKNVLTIPIKLTKTVNFPVNATVTLRGAKSQEEDYGFGKNYILSGVNHTATDTSTISVTIPAGQTETNISLAIVNNPTVDRRSIALSIVSNTSGVTGAGGPTITVTDASLPGGTYIADATQSNVSGAVLVGDGATDNTAALNTMFTYIAGQGNGTGYISLPAGGTYMFGSNPALMYQGVTLAGPENGTRPVFRRVPASVWSSNGGFSISSENGTRITLPNHGLGLGKTVYFTGITQAGWTDFAWQGATDTAIDRQCGGLTFPTGMVAFFVHPIDVDTFYIVPKGSAGRIYHRVFSAAPGNPTVITSPSHGFTEGNKIYIRLITNPNWTSLNSQAYVISNVTDDTFTIAVDSTGWGNLVSDKTSNRQYCDALFNTNGRTAFDDSGAVMHLAPKICDGLANAPYNSIVDSKPVAIKNIDFDGNNPNNGPWINYDLEQHVMLFFSTNLNTGRVVSKVENCDIYNGPADGVLSYLGSDCNIYNVNATDVYRGAVIMHGGRSITRITNLTTKAGQFNDITGIDAEVDTNGYGGDPTHDVYLKNVTLYHGDCDIGLKPGSILYAENLYIGRIPAGARSSIMYDFVLTGVTSTFKNCTIYSGHYLASNGNRILKTGNMTWEDSTFIATNCGNPVESFISAFPRIGSIDVGATITLRNCTFKADDTIAADFPKWAITVAGDYIPSDNKSIIVEGTSFIESSLNGGLYRPDYHWGSPTIKFYTTTFNHNGDNNGYAIKAGTTSTYYYDFTFQDLDINGPFANFTSSQAGCNVRLDNVRMSQVNNILAGSPGGITFSGYSGATVMRFILGSAAPINGTTKGLFGSSSEYDQYRYNDGGTMRYYKTTAPNTWLEYTP